MTTVSPPSSLRVTLPPSTSRLESACAASELKKSLERPRIAEGPTHPYLLRWLMAAAAAVGVVSVVAVAVGAVSVDAVSVGAVALGAVGSVAAAVGSLLEISGITEARFD